MKMHWGKGRTEKECKLSIKGEDIEHVKKLRHLGAVINADGKRDEEVEQCVKATAKVVGAMRKEVLERRELMRKTMLQVFNAMVPIPHLWM